MILEDENIFFYVKGFQVTNCSLPLTANLILLLSVKSKGNKINYLRVYNF